MRLEVLFVTEMSIIVKLCGGFFNLKFCINLGKME